MSTSAALRALVRDVLRCTRGHDLALYAAGVTFCAAVGAVPPLLLSLFLAGLAVGPDTVLVLATELAALLPLNLGALDAARSLARSGSELQPLAALAAFVPAACTPRARPRLRPPVGTGRARPAHPARPLGPVLEQDRARPGVVAAAA